jgi:hypothetical protein
MTRPQITSPGKSPARYHKRLAVLAGLFLQAQVYAATVPDLYAAQVPMSTSGSAGLDEAFSQALAAVLVKLTGQRGLPADPAVRETIGKAAPLVSQYQVADGGSLRVQFDRQALRRRMDAARLPVWADERPQTLVVLVDPAAAPEALVSDEQLVLETAASRGLPVAMLRPPAGTAEDPLQSGENEAARVGADLVLVGRRAPVSGSAAWRWTLQDGAERSEWQGDATQGVHQLADQLAARYAVAAAASSRLRLEIQGVGSFADYGRLQDYLRGVGVIESLAMRSLRGDSIVYDLVVRGSADQLRDALALKRLLVPVVPAEGVAVSTADLVYRISSAP